MPRSSETNFAYRRVETLLRRRIQQGEWSVGMMLPGRHRLAREHGVALRTMERAVAHLVTEGILRAEDGRGTFVARSIVASPLAPALHENGPVEGGPRPPLGRGRAGRTTTMGVITVGGSYPILTLEEQSDEEFNKLWLHTIITAAESVFSSAGGAARFYTVASGVEPMPAVAEAIGVALSEGVDALLVVGIHDGEAQATPTRLTLEALKLPGVYISARAVEGSVPHVFYDSEDAGYQAARHLLEQGYRELLFLSPFNAWWIEERIAGARAALREANLPDEALIVYPEERPWAWPQEHGDLTARATEEAFNSGLIRSGVIVPYDRAAYSFLKVAGERNAIAGSDFGLVSFDDHVAARSHGLTSLRPPLEEMGQEAGLLLLAAIRGEATPRQVRLRSSLLVRSSSQRISPLA